MSLWMLPLAVFIGSGIIDLTIGFYSDEGYIQSATDYYVISTLPFFMASILGVVVLIVLAIRGKLRLGKKELIGGITLGIVNYGAIIFLVKAVSSMIFQKSALFPVNNLGIILLSTVASILVFKERLSRQNFWGMLISIAAIILFWVDEAV
ncbi:MAG: hypothetical protein HKN32_03315 [Flavobacteriales bacterium]|nr:hypothetical protein [Flavobacteriales bacterium]